jgi:signal transduction histidine kinase
MGWRAILKYFNHLELQGKVSLILISVIFPVSILLGLAQSSVVEPLLQEEIRQVGVSFAQNLASQIKSQKLLGKSNSAQSISDKIQSMVYSQPGIIRVDVIGKKPGTGDLYFIASNVEDSENQAPTDILVGDQASARLEKEDELPVWNILHPVKSGNERAMIRVLVSLRFVSGIQALIHRINLIAAILSTVLLILILSFLLKRTIENERQLKVAQESNAALSGRLQETQQALIQTEKLAAMGQLTASFAHEIGTPLNAIGGHLQLLEMGLEKQVAEEIKGGIRERMGIITGQLRKIEDIVKGFLQTTKKPIARQLSTVAVPDLVQNVLALVEPTFTRHGIQCQTKFDSVAERVEVVPLEIEQVILNLINNAIDSMKDRESGSNLNLGIRTWTESVSDRVVLEIADTGTGIPPENIKQVFKPFFTTKTDGAGHGLGLSICQQIIRSYGGEVMVDSEWGAGTRVRVSIPVVRRMA